MSDDKTGLYAKYTVINNKTGEPLAEPCFILRYHKDPHARHALWEYAESVASENPTLAGELRRAVLESMPDAER